MTVPMPFGMNVPGLLVSPLLVPVAVLVQVRMHVPGLLMHLRAVPLAMLAPWRMHVPGLRVDSRGMPLALVVAPRMDVPGPLTIQPDDPPRPMVARVLVPSPVVTVDEEGTVVRVSPSHADAHSVPVLRPLAGRRAEQSADDAAHDRAFPRPFVIGAGGRGRHRRAERNGGGERDHSKETLFPAPHHRLPPDPMVSPWRRAPAD